MAFNPDPRVGEARRLAKKYRQSHVIIIMCDMNTSTMQYASFGNTARRCDEARKLADAAFEAVRKAWKL